MMALLTQECRNTKSGRERALDRSEPPSENIAVDDRACRSSRGRYTATSISRSSRHSGRIDVVGGGGGGLGDTEFGELLS